jgi:hypothetical protein
MLKIRKSNPHLHDLRLLFEVRMKVSISLRHPWMLAKVFQKRKRADE